MKRNVIWGSKAVAHTQLDSQAGGLLLRPPKERAPVKFGWTGRSFFFNPHHTPLPTLSLFRSLSLNMAFALSRSATPLRATTPSRTGRKAAAPARALAGDGARVDRSKKTDVM